MQKTTEKRPPVVVVMGHIDHGKSTILDFIRKSNVVEKEAGGITQHISAYEAETKYENTDRKITFIDTPGHEAFRAMRSTGGLAADIAVLVVSAEDGVKPQTKEALQWIQENRLPYLVAFTKIDKEGANIEQAKQSLAEAGVYVEGYGGDIPWVAVSGKTGEGIKELLDTILLVADLNDVHDKDPKTVRGIIIESHRDPKKGITATAILKNGTLVKKGFVATDKSFTPLKMIENFAGKAVQEISSGSPVRIIGWNKVPDVGSEFLTYYTKDDAIKATIKENKEIETVKNETGNKKLIPIIIKTDTSGSLEALIFEINKFAHERVAPKIILSGIGNISESDIKTAQGTEESLVVGFHTNIDAPAKSLAERLNIVVITDDIIYKLTEKVFKEIEKRSPRITIEKITGKGKILKTFSKTRDKQILGGKVSEGVIKLGAQVNIMRRGTKLDTGKIKELQYLKDRINEAEEGREFGALVEAKAEIAVGDELESFEIETTR